MSRVALITGGQQGIGRGIAAALAGAGFELALSSHEPDDAPAVRAALAKLGPGVRYFRHDLRAAEQVSALLDRIEAELGPVTSLVANAGIPARQRGDLLDVSADAFDDVLGVNLRGNFFLAQEAARRMLDLPAEPYRALIFVTSVSAAMVSIERAEYCISKAGASMLASLFAVRLAAAGIGVFELRPGIIDTAMTAGVKDKYDKQIADGLVPAARWGQPADIGSAVLPLVDGSMAYATGSVIALDGGLSIPRF